MGVNFGLVSHQAENRPIKITIGVNIFWERGKIIGWLGVINIQFKALPPRIAVRVIKNIGVVINKSLSVRFEQGMECLGVHRIIIIIRIE
jgi:hypothetical protein